MLVEGEERKLDELMGFSGKGQGPSTLTSSLLDLGLGDSNRDFECMPSSLKLAVERARECNITFNACQPMLFQGGHS